LITIEECESIYQFMDATGTGKFGIRAFMEVFNNERLYAFTQKGLINNQMMFYAIFESLEEMLLETHSQMTE
jgi:phosphoribosylaminoimidazole-succinocarboxamide synthase